MSLVGIVIYRFMAKPASESFLGISLALTLSLTKYYRKLRQSLNGTTAEHLAKVRQFYTKTHKLIVRFDALMTIVCHFIVFFGFNAFIIC